MNKFLNFLKTNKALCIVTSCVVVGGVVTATLIETLPDPYFKVSMINVMGGPQNFEPSPPDPNPDGSPGHQYLVFYKDGTLAYCSDNPAVNDPVLASRCNNSHYYAAPLGKSIDGGKIPTTKHGNRPFVNWKIQEDVGTKAPSWLSIGNNDDDDFGTILVNHNKNDWHPCSLFFLISASMGGITGYGDILHIIILDY